MRVYKFTHTIEYTVEAEDETDAISQVVDLIRQDWAFYFDIGNLGVGKLEEVRNFELGEQTG